MLTYSDDYFDRALELGFASSIRREWDWRVKRGESLANLRAFARFADPDRGLRSWAVTEPGNLGHAQPNVARMYDHLLGGTDNFAIDREAAGRVLEILPGVRTGARENRAFLGRAVRFLVRQGVRQFIDIGAGLPTLAVRPRGGPGLPDRLRGQRPGGRLARPHGCCTASPAPDSCTVTSTPPRRSSATSRSTSTSTSPSRSCS